MLEEQKTRLEKNDFLNSLGIDTENLNVNNVNIDIDKCWNYIVKIAKGRNVEDILRYKVVNTIMNLIKNPTNINHNYENNYKLSSSASSIGAFSASFNSWVILSICSWEIITSEALSAGTSTKVRFGSEVNFFNSHKNGFSN